MISGVTTSFHRLDRHRVEVHGKTLQHARSNERSLGIALIKPKREKNLAGPTRLLLRDENCLLNQRKRVLIKFFAYCHVVPLVSEGAV